MHTSELHSQLQQLEQRLGTLQRRAVEGPVPAAEVLPEALTELQGSLEELHVTNEELHQQNEELTAARQAAEAERQRYRELFDFAPYGYVVTDARGTIREANHAAVVMLAVPQDRLSGKPLVTFVPQEERRAFRAQLSQLPRRERVQEWETRLQPRQGTPFYTAVAVTAVRNPQGKVVGLRWLLHDISTHKALTASIERLYAQLRAEQQQLQSLLQYLSEGVALLDSDWRLVLANPAARCYLAVLTAASMGERVATLGGKPVEHFFVSHPEGLPHEVVGGSPPQVFEIQVHAIIGGPEAGSWVLLIKDVTAERAVQQHTALQERLASMGQLTASIAHDFNNLLTVVSGYADLLKKRADLPQSVQDDLTIIAEQGQRGAQLVHQMLDFSCQSSTQPYPIDLLSVLKKTCTLLERTLPESIHMVLESAPGDYLINAEADQIQQVLTNLAENARDAMPQGGELRFSLSYLILSPGTAPPNPAMAPGTWVVLAVSDTGRGMSPQVRRRVFEPFFTTKPRGWGAGLGLAQVYGIVKQHHGYITVQSRPRQGTTFTLYVPAQRMPARASGAVALEEVPHGQGETLLLVEDEPQVLRLLCSMLERLHYQVLTATNGQEALAVYERHSNAIALVLTDLVLPGVGGVALFHALRQCNPSVKVIVLTGYPLQEEAQALLTQEVAAWLQKPSELPVLARTVRRALTGQGVPPA